MWCIKGWPCSSMSPDRRANCLWFQSTYNSTETSARLKNTYRHSDSVCTDWERNARIGICVQEVPRLHLRSQDYSRDWSPATSDKFQEPLHPAPMRLQYILFKLQCLDIDLVYKRGTSLHVADALFHPHTFQILVLMRMRTMTSYWSHLSPHPRWGSFNTRLHRMQPCSNWCPTSSMVGQTVSVMRLRSSSSTTLSVNNSQHHGVLSWKETSFLCDDIEKYVAYCATCNSYKSHQQKKPMQLHAVPDRAWQIIVTKLFEWEGKSCLVLTESFSGRLMSTTPHHIPCCSQQQVEATLCSTKPSETMVHNTPVMRSRTLLVSGVSLTNQQSRASTAKWTGWTCCSKCKYVHDKVQAQWITRIHQSINQSIKFL